jgi:hypothetical protein
VQFRVLRVALDWAKVLIRQWVTGQCWKRVEQWCDAGTVDLVVPGTGRVLPLRARRTMRGEAVLSGSGVRIVVRRAAVYRRPTTRPADPVQAVTEQARVVAEVVALEAELAQQPYGVEFDVQGAALSASVDGLDVLEDVRSAVEALLFRHAGATPVARRAVLAPHTFLGRWDLAVDAAARGLRASEWIERGLYRGGHLDRARADWKTRVRCESTAQMVEREAVEQAATVRELVDVGQAELARLVGNRRLGRTLYLGTAPAFARVYERDKHTRDGHWEVLAATLRQDCGWDGVSRVVRFELEAQRQWMRDQEIERDGETVRLHTLPLDDVLAALPVIVRQLAERYTHCEGGQVSAWWTAVRAGLRGFTPMPAAARPCPWTRLRSVKRARAVARAAEGIAAGLVTITEVEAVPTHVAMVRGLEALHDPRNAARWERLRVRLRREGLSRVVPERSLAVAMAGGP